MVHVLYDLGSSAASWYEATSHRSAGDFGESLSPGSRLTADVCVVGGGFTGLSAALELALRGRRVILLEARFIGFGASGRNGGQIIGGWHHSYSAIGKRFGAGIRDACFAISEDGKSLIRDRVETYSIDCDLRWGYTHLALKNRHLREMVENLEDWEAMGYRHGSLLDRSALGEKLHSDLYVGGLRDSYSGHMHPLNYALGLGRALRAAGGVIYEGAQATRIDCDSGEVYVGENSMIRAEHIIIAGNAYINLHPLLPRLHRRIMPVVSNIGATPPLSSELRDLGVRDGDAYADYNFIVDYFRMSSDGRLLFGGRASYGDNEPKDLEVWMRRRLARVFPALRDVGFDYLWGGRIGVTMNRYPDVGRLGKRGFYAQGYSGHGVLLSNMCGRILADSVMGIQDRFDIFSLFRHRNFPGGRWRRGLLVLGMLYYRLQDAL